tara:strand:+ start:360 stop:1466 length:1107 start_codon:yes stop_codon:yes gene_type:complete
MKVSIGTKVVDGPWGGGNLFVKNLIEYLKSKNITVVDNLESNDIDIILLIDPRKDSENVTFNHVDIANYLAYENPNAKVIHRINECDERKNTSNINQFYIEANKCADHTVYVSSWIRDLYLSQGMNSVNSVIMTGADKKIFNNLNRREWKSGDKLRIITHHWGDDWNKGFKIYRKLDNLLSTNKWKNKIEFTYIGNLPKGLNLDNTNIISPKHGLELSDILKNHHIYLTASINEPSGNHHIEGAQCGLPLLYIESGGIPEFCNGFGVSFNDTNFEIKLTEMIDNYRHFREKIKNYPQDSIKMSQEYLKLFSKIKNENSSKNINNLKNNLLIYKLKKYFKKLYINNHSYQTFYNNLRRIYLFIKSKIKT